MDAKQTLSSAANKGRTNEEFAGKAQLSCPIQGPVHLQEATRICLGSHFHIAWSCALHPEQRRHKE